VASAAAAADDDDDDDDGDAKPSIRFQSIVDASK